MGSDEDKSFLNFLAWLFLAIVYLPWMLWKWFKKQDKRIQIFTIVIILINVMFIAVSINAYLGWFMLIVMILSVVYFMWQS